jgi:Rrf2 family transcriptional regulator, nitric oxide-sensitive transcriptional repressor
MFSSTVEYALRAVTWMAGRPDEAMTAQRIAAATSMPEDYLSKVLQQLARAGLLTSQRGRNGGFRLSQNPEDISMLHVVNAVEPIQRIRQCPLGLKEHGVKLCALHRRLDDAYKQVEQAFADTTLAELVPARRPKEPLCRPAQTQLEVLHA